MTYTPLAYDDADSTATMSHDADACRIRLAPPTRRTISERAVEDAPSILFVDNATEVPKREITVHEAAYRLASALQLHLD